MPSKIWVALIGAAGMVLGAVGPPLIQQIFTAPPQHITLAGAIMRTAIPAVRVTPTDFDATLSHDHTTIASRWRRGQDGRM